ncbi:glycosyltransferase family 2 protein [Longibaculum muris]|uniref:glycosyltransferase family 2 protein n=1 Tax=Longibaculum muris TaxID=1796628 RepID=UPI00189C790D|nr:glycosyltransferase family 2 protein [Longibaculum muris]
MDDLVSIIMPSYNTANYIEESIQSVLNQTYTNWELIIVDDCSTDNTDEIISKFLEDKRIHYFKNEKNLGAAVSRNKALREANGRWITFLDSDDLWNSLKLEKQINFMISNDYHFSYTCYKEIDEENREMGVIISGPKKITKFGMHTYCWPGCLTVMYDAKFNGLIQIKDIKKNNDYALWLNLCKKSNCYLYCEILASYRKRQGSISNQKKYKLIKYHYILYKECMCYSVLKSIFFTNLNLIFGMIKKIIYKDRQYE